MKMMTFALLLCLSGVAAVAESQEQEMVVRENKSFLGIIPASKRDIPASHPESTAEIKVGKHVLYCIPPQSPKIHRGKIQGIVDSTHVLINKMPIKVAWIVQLPSRRR